MNFIQHTKEFVKEYFEQHNNVELTYHSLEHTLLVAAKLKDIAEKGQLSYLLKEQLVVAAYLHDIGYLHNIYHHEDKSIEMAREYLKKQGKDEAYLSSVSICINSTKHTETPTSEIAALLKDTDLSYGLYTNFKTRGDQLRQEWDSLHNKQYTDEAWAEIQVNFLQDLRFHSPFGKTHFQQLRLEEIEKFR